MKLPGSYRLNPYAYSWQLVDAIEIGPDQVGVRILKVGKDPRELKVEPHLASVGRETLADVVLRDRPTAEVGAPVTVELSGGSVRIWLRAIHGEPGAE